MLYHVLLKDHDVDGAEWGSYPSAIWTVWLFSLGQFDDSAFPNLESQIVFSIFALVIIVVMM